MYPLFMPEQITQINSKLATKAEYQATCSNN